MNSGIGFLRAFPAFSAVRLSDPQKESSVEGKGAIFRYSDKQQKRPPKMWQSLLFGIPSNFLNVNTIECAQKKTVSHSNH